MMEQFGDLRAATFCIDGGECRYRVQNLKQYLDDNIQRLVSGERHTWVLVGVYDTDEAAVEACEALKVSIESGRIARDYIQRTERDRRKGGDRRRNPR